MTISLLDLYNTAATQEWSMYDNDALSQDEFESALVLALNKAIAEILYSYSFNFRLKTHLILTLPRIKEYNLPKGLIKKDYNGDLQVKYNSKLLCFEENIEKCVHKSMEPTAFCIIGNKIVLNSAPSEKGMLTIDYYTLAIGQNKEGEDIFALKNQDDILDVPEYLEELLKNAVIARAMLNSIASESDENYSAYKKQSETAYRLLVKYSKGVGVDKSIKL